MSRTGSPPGALLSTDSAGVDSSVPCRLCPTHSCRWARAGPALAGRDSASEGVTRPRLLRRTDGSVPWDPCRTPWGARVPCPFVYGRGIEGSDELSFVTGRVSTPCFQVPSLTESVHPQFRGSASEPDRPRLGPLTHPDGVLGWRLPSDQVQPGTRHRESASIWPRENSTFTAIL